MTSIFPKLKTGLRDLSKRIENVVWHLSQDYALYANLFKRKDDLPKAKENLNKAIEILKECDSDGWVERYEKELAEL